MKMSAWIRFCLIVLCLAMACSMFACRNPEEQTTEKPEQVTTEAPSVEKPTEQPTEKPTETPTTEAPVTETTEAPATEPTEAPVTETTEAPATETTEAPATETTEAPATETTEAPATETTEAPATETTEEVTNTYLEEETIVIGGIEYVEEAASPYAYNIDSHGGAPGQTIIATADNFTQVVSGLKGWIAIRPGILKYVYAIVVDGVQGEWIDFTKTMLPDGSNTVGYNRNDVIDHIAKNFPGFESGIAGTNCGFNLTHTIDLSQYHGRDVSIVYYAVVYKVDSAGDRVLDPEGNGIEGAWIHMATAIDVMPEHYGVGGYRDNGDGTHSIKCEGCDEYYITEACNPAFGSGATATDTNTHTGMTCGLCGQTGIEGPHSAPSNYVWDDEQGIYTTYYNEVVWNSTQNKYNSVCIACGGQVGDAFGAVHSVELETITMGGVWETAQSNEETYAIITMKAGLQGDKWRATYFKVNPNGLRTGQYIAIRYMIPTEGANPTHFTIVNGGWSVDVPVIADGEWHIVLIEAPGKDASFAIPSGDTRLNFIGAYTGWNEGDQICLDWIKTYDSVEALNLDLKIGQEDCACPDWAIEVVEYAGVEGHSVRCTICGRGDTASHTPSSTRGVAVEGGYAKACTVCGGATAEPAMGLLVFDKDYLLNVTLEADNVNAGATKEETADGVKFVNLGAKDSLATIFSGNSHKTGKYFFIKYRTANLTSAQFYMWNANGGHNNANPTPTFVNDNAWHIAVIEVQYETIAQLRMDLEGTGVPELEIAYLGYADNAITLAKAIKALDSGADDICECPALFAIGNYVDEDTHAPVCQLCGETGAPVAHAGAKYGTWNEELGYYVSNTECTTCGELYNFGATVKMQSSSIWGSAGSWNIGLSYTENGTWLLTKKNDAGVWAESHLKINPDQVVTGQYMIIKYKAKGHTGTFNMPFSAGSLKSGAYSGTTLPIVFDEAEHVIILDLSTLANYTANDDGTYSYGHFDKARMTWSNLPKGANIEFTSIAMYDHVDRLPAISEADCPHTIKVSAIIDAENHGVKCAICDKTISTEAHVWSSTDCATVLPTCSCGAEKEELGHTAAGADGEYCKACKTFLTTQNYSSYFKLFYGGATMPWSNAGTAKSSWSKTSGYMVYTDNNTDGGFTLFTGNTAETGNWAVMKYKSTTNTLGAEWFTSTVQNAPSGSYNLSLASSLVFDTWQYFIVDLSTAIGNSGVVVNGDGKYVLQSLRFDVEGGGAIEIAYIGFASSLADIIAGVKAIEDDYVDENYCPHNSFLLASPEYADEYTHSATCNLCGDVPTFDHTGATSGVWSETLGYYESATACTACGETYRLDALYVEEAENGVIRGESGWGSSHAAKNGYVEYCKFNSTWGAGKNNFNAAGVTTGRYLAVRYRVEAGNGNKVLFNESVAMPVIADGNWHVAFIDMNTDTIVLNTSTGKFMFTSNEGWDVGSKIWFDWFRTYDSLDRIPDFGDECAHGVSAPDAVWAVVGDGTATETAACAVCGEAGASTRALSFASSWDTMYAQDGSSVLMNGTIMGGWTIMTGGTLRGEFVISDGENTVTVVGPEITNWDTGVATQGSNKFGYMGEDRGYSRYNLTIEDWSNVEGVDFTGKSITITAYAVSKADPTVKVKTVSARPATVAAATAEPTEVPAE